MKTALTIVFIIFSLPALAADGLRVAGNKIMYGTREVQLQGIAVGDPLLVRGDRPLSDYAFLSQDWNSNVVRISIHPGTWRDYGRLRVMSELRRNVDAALAAHMFVIITWQAIGVPDDYMQKAEDALVSDVYDTDMRLARDFWREVAKAYGHDGRVMFELWNEPVFPRSKDPHWLKLKPFWENLIGLVRYYGNNLIIVTSNGWGYNLQGVRSSLLADENTAYAWHAYAGTDGNDPEAWERNLDGLWNIKPVLVTEWGFESEAVNVPYAGTAAGYGYLFYDRFIQGKQLHHTAWCWHPVWTPRMLKPDWKTLTPYGAFVKEMLWRRSKDTLVRP